MHIPLDEEQLTKFSGEAGCFYLKEESHCPKKLRVKSELVKRWRQQIQVDLHYYFVQKIKEFKQKTRYQRNEFVKD